MLRKPLLSLLFALLLGALFAGGLARLFILRYETGDIYPPYSSLRADPLGTKALAAALAELPGVTVQSNFKSLPKLRPTGPVTLVYAGVSDQSFWNGPELLAFDSLVANGTRALFTFLPVETPPTKSEDERSKEQEHKKKEVQTEEEKSREKAPIQPRSNPQPDKPKGDDQQTGKAAEGKKGTTGGKDRKEDDEAGEQTEPLIGFDTVGKRWGFSFGYLPEEKGRAFDRHAALVEPGGRLESDISWHSALCFRDLKPPWKVLYMCGTMPVVIERPYGNGSIVLVADSFLVSNEALRGERYPLLLSRLFSGPSQIVFDEEHNNLRENPGVAYLVRKYRLHGVIAGLLLLAILFVWKNAVRFVPAYEVSPTGLDIVEGKESSEGFINLLRRTIAASAILETCLNEWRKTFAHQPRILAKAEEIWTQEQARPPRQRDPVAAYRALSRALAHKR
jgi:hypothetical protein